ncbi:hypothetical protein V8C37DRAFT_305588 [Trichoderma ceciliae]
MRFRHNFRSFYVYLDSVGSGRIRCFQVNIAGIYIDASSDDGMIISFDLNDQPSYNARLSFVESNDLSMRAVLGIMTPWILTCSSSRISRCCIQILNHNVPNQLEDKVLPGTKVPRYVLVFHFACFSPKALNSVLRRTLQRLVPPPQQQPAFAWLQSTIRSLSLPTWRCSSCTAVRSNSPCYVIHRGAAGLVTLLCRLARASPISSELQTIDAGWSCHRSGLSSDH